MEACRAPARPHSFTPLVGARVTYKVVIYIFGEISVIFGEITRYLGHVAFDPNLKTGRH